MDPQVRKVLDDRCREVLGVTPRQSQLLWRTRATKTLAMLICRLLRESSSASAFPALSLSDPISLPICPSLSLSL